MPTAVAQGRNALFDMRELLGLAIMIMLHLVHYRHLQQTLNGMRKHQHTKIPSKIAKRNIYPFTTITRRIREARQSLPHPRSIRLRLGPNRSWGSACGTNMAYNQTILRLSLVVNPLGKLKVLIQSTSTQLTTGEQYLLWGKYRKLTLTRWLCKQ